MIIGIASKYDSRVVNGDPTNISLAVNVIYIGTTQPDRDLIGENNNADVPIDLTGVSSIAGLRTATAAAIRAWATANGFTVPANAVLCQTYQTA